MDSIVNETPIVEYPYAEAKRAYRISGAALFALILTVQLSVVILSVAVKLLCPQLISTGWFLIVFNFVCLYGLGAPIYLAVISKAAPIKPEKKKMKAGSFVIAAIISIGLIFSLNLVTVVIITAIEFILGISLPSNLDAMLSGSDMWLAILSTVVVAPILEELFFRRLLCDRLKQYGEWQAILFSALAFSMFHTSLHQMLYAFGLGCIFGLIYVRTGKLRYTVMLHAIVNFVGSVPGLLMLEYGVDKTVTEYSELLSAGKAEQALEFLSANIIPILSYMVYIIVLGNATIAGVVLFFVFLRRMIRSADGSCMPKKKSFAIMFSGVLTILFFVICIGLTVYAAFI